jgi:transcriptional regulator with XRE-family HTH domain
VAAKKVEDPDEVRRRVGQRINELREDAGMTQRAVAEDVGIDVASYQRIESGGQNLTLRTMTLIAGAFGLPTIALLELPTRVPAKRVRGRPKKASGSAKRASGR